MEKTKNSPVISDPKVLDVCRGLGLSESDCIGKGKSGYSFRSETNAGMPTVVKIYHNEPVSYYTFQGEKIDVEMAAYARLTALEIPVPELIEVNRQEGWIRKKYVEGKIGNQLTTSRGVTSEMILFLNLMSEKCVKAGINIDYYPANFVWDGKEMWYVDYETNPFHSTWDFWNWGVWFWANAFGFKYLEETGSMAALVNPENGLPLRDGNQFQVNKWKEYCLSRI